MAELGTGWVVDGGQGGRLFQPHNVVTSPIPYRCYHALQVDVQGRVQALREAREPAAAAAAAKGGIGRGEGQAGDEARAYFSARAADKAATGGGWDIGTPGRVDMGEW